MYDNKDSEITQPQNRENNLQATLDNYKLKINKQFPGTVWLSHAFQKDGIQNSWGAKTNKHDWAVKLFAREINGNRYVGIEDENTSGLIGRVPNEDLSVQQILHEVDDTDESAGENLSYFLSQDYTNKKGKNTGGSRGRGKIVFLGISQDRWFYFDSLRQDGSFIAGYVRLDRESKEIKQKIFEGKEAEQFLEEHFGGEVNKPFASGTRIFALNPTDEVWESFSQGQIDNYIKETWWEILVKFEAKILVDFLGTVREIGAENWLPVEKMGISDTREYDQSRLKLLNFNPLSLKKISLCYLGEDRDVPESYRGISIQREGMVVQKLETKTLIDVPGAEKIYGTLEFTPELAVIIKDEFEDPEHYEIDFSSREARATKDLLKKTLKEFAEDIGLGQEGQSDKSVRREAEITAIRNLNQLAKELGFKLVGLTRTKKKRKGEDRDIDQPVRLSSREFDTEQPFGRVDYGEKVLNAFVVPVNETENDLTVKVKCWFVFKGEDGKASNPLDLSGMIQPSVSELELLGHTEYDKANMIGWEEITIEKDNFKPGVYVFKAEMTALEEGSLKIKIDGREKYIHFRKGETIHKIACPFYVEIEKPDNGLFDIQGEVRPDRRDLYYKWDDSSGAIQITYNMAHPAFRDLELIKKQKEKEKAQERECLKMGTYSLAVVALKNDKERIDNGEKAQVYTEDNIIGLSSEDEMELVMRKQSEFLWLLLEGGK